MAIEEARANASEYGGRILLRMTQQWCGATKWVKHHVFPRALKRDFEAIGIKVDRYTLRVPDWYNKWVHSCGPRGGWWNQKWREFFAAYKDPKTGEFTTKPSHKKVLEYLDDLLRQTGLEDVKLWELEPY